MRGKTGGGAYSAMLLLQLISLFSQMMLLLLSFPDSLKMWDPEPYLQGSNLDQISGGPWYCSYLENYVIHRE